MMKVCTVLLSCLLCLPVNAQNFTGKGGEAFIQRNNQIFKGSIYTQIFQGDRITTSDKPYIYDLDFNSGTMFQRNNTTVEVAVLSRPRGCSVTHLVYSGKGISWKKKPFTCKLSRLIIFNTKGGIYVSPNSDIELKEKNDSIIAIVKTGDLEQEKDGIIENIRSGEFNVTDMNGKPGKPQKYDYFQTIKNWHVEYSPTAVIINFNTSPVNDVKINGIPFAVSPSGEVKALIKYPILESDFYVELDSPFSSKIVIKPLEKSKIYR